MTTVPSVTIIGTIWETRVYFPVAGGDLYVAPDDKGDAMHGDLVVAHILRKGKRGGQMRVSARIIEILERAQQRLALLGRESMDRLDVGLW